MARRYDFVGDVTPAKETWRIKARIIRLWKVPVYGSIDQTNTIEFVLQDEKNGKIQAIVKKPFFSKFESLLKEGKCYTFQNFVVSQNGGQYRPTKHPYKINFLFSTSVKESDCQTMGDMTFDFASFTDIVALSVDNSYLVDVIGRITAVGNIQLSNLKGRESRRVKVELTDTSNNTLTCTLWDDFANHVAEYTSQNPLPIIMVLQFAQIKFWQGANSVSNAMYCSRLFFDPAIPEVLEFKNSIDSGNDSLAKLGSLSTTSETSAYDDFLHTERKTLDEIRESNKVCSCVVVATILRIETEHNWFYNGCNRCKKKVQSRENGFYCTKCCDNCKFVAPCFKVQVRVMDETSSASFVLFDRDCYQFMGKTAADLRATVIKGGDPDTFPEDLENFVNRKFFFKIQITEYNLRESQSTYSVLRMSDSPKLLDSSEKTHNKNQSDEETPGGGDFGESFSSVTPTSSKNKEIFDVDNDDESHPTEGQMSTNKIQFKKIKIEKED